MAALLYRIWTAFNPPVVTKNEDALKFGILGAAKTAPLTLIIPAKSHPEVVVQAIASRDRKKGEAFAKKHGIPEVKNSYQEIIDDPNINCVYIPLPNSLHFEWAVRAIQAGKHVFLEKPSTANATEAEILFNLPELSKPNAPVILEAFHNRFHPVWALFRTLISPVDVEHAHAYSMIPAWGVSSEDIYFNYSLAGGSMMQMGTYNCAALREVFKAEPTECLSCTVSVHGNDEKDMNKVDNHVEAKYSFPNGGTGEIYTTLQGPAVWKLSNVAVKHKPVKVPDESLAESEEKFRTREVTMYGFIHGVIWHRIDVTDVYEIRSKEEEGKVIKKWEEKKSHKAYNFEEAGGKFSGLQGETFWMSYRYQLDQFVNRVKGRETLYWVDKKDSIDQMKMIDMAYEKSGLGARQTSTFRPS